MSNEKITEEQETKKKKPLALKIAEWVVTVIFGVLFIFVAAGTIDGMVHKQENYGESLKFGWAYFMVKTNSMEPVYNVNSAIVTHKDDVESLYSYYKENETHIRDTKQADRNEKDEKIYLDITFKDVYGQGIAHPTNTDYYEDVSGSSGMVMTHRLREIKLDKTKNYGEGRYTFIVSGTNIEGHLSEKGQFQAFTEKQYLGVVKTNSPALGGFFNFISSVWGLLIMLLIPAFFLVITSVLDIFKAVKEPDEEDGGSNSGSNDSSNESTGNTNRVSSMSSEDKERLKKELLEQMIAEKKAAKEKAAEKKDEVQ